MPTCHSVLPSFAWRNHIDRVVSDPGHFPTAPKPPQWWTSAGQTGARTNSSEDSSGLMIYPAKELAGPRH